MITTTLVNGTLMFEEANKIPETAKIVVVLSDAEDNPILEKDVSFDSKLLSVFKYLPFELRNFELPEGHKCHVRAFVDTTGAGKRENASFVSRESVPIITGLEEVVLNLAKINA